ncbi:MAG: hypothetical protein HKO87_04210 [Acidimicrobiia bacterium]|nr:Rid family detoxifying hydrolase [Acidimicrobiia bacterium]NNK91616.1 hypothetical protein [Acidimicrobiia bacterium]
MPKTIPEVAGVPAPFGPYSVVTEANGFVFVSGQVAIDPVTQERVTGGIEDQTHQAMRNLGAVLRGVGLDYDDIVKTTLFLADMADYPTVNEIYSEYVGEARPARSTIQAAALPGGFLFEIDAVAAR